MGFRLSNTPSQQTQVSKCIFCGKLEIHRADDFIFSFSFFKEMGLFCTNSGQVSWIIASSDEKPNNRDEVTILQGDECTGLSWVLNSETRGKGKARQDGTQQVAHELSLVFRLTGA